MRTVEGYWGINPITKRRDDDLGLRDMCDYGARKVRDKQYDAVEFHIMPCEIDPLKAYMREKYPDVPYRLNYPGWRA